MKTKTSFTPGPWTIFNGKIMSTDKDQYFIAEIPGPFSRLDRANALLISAAPELLACLREVVFLTEGISGLDEQQTAAINAARAVIAKATI